MLVSGCVCVWFCVLVKYLIGDSFKLLPMFNENNIQSIIDVLI